MFRRLLTSNPTAHLRDRYLAEYGGTNAESCPATSARRGCSLSGGGCAQHAVKDGAFDTVVCCYLLELLGEADIMQTMAEMRRVLRPNGRLALVLIGQQLPRSMPG